MQVPILTLNAVAPAPLPTPVLSSSAPAPSHPHAPASAPVSVIKLPPLQPPTKASAQSVIEAQIKDRTPQKPVEIEDSTDKTLEKRAQDAARTKSIWRLLPTKPSQVTKLMSALTSATSAEAIAKIQLDASANPELDSTAA